MSSFSFSKSKILRIGGVLILTFILAAFARRTSMVRSVAKTVKQSNITIEHTTVPKNVGEKDAVIEAKVTALPKLEPHSVKLYYKIGKGKLKSEIMIPKSPTSNPGQAGIYVGKIPHQKKGSVAYYFIKVDHAKGSSVTLPEKTDSQKQKFVRLKFEGEVSLLVLGLHILSMFAAIFFGWLTFFSAFEVRKGNLPLKNSVKLAIWTFVFLFLGCFPFGWAMNYQAFGVIWEGFPFGLDITDNKTQFAFLFWLVTLILVKGSVFGGNPQKNLISSLNYSRAVMISFTVTILMYLIPHSL